MSETLSVHATKRATGSRNPRELRGTNPSRPKPVAHRRKKLHALIEVPMLDWPTHLFNDNATMAELLVEDSPMRWGLPALSSHHRDSENYIRAAA
jgi:hypothetical protein